MMKRILIAIIATTMFLSVVTSCNMKTEKELGALKGVKNPKLVAQLTGEKSKNKTDNYSVYGCDLGSMIEMDGKVYMVFGDTYGYRDPKILGAGGDLWRSNTMAVISDNNPSDGLTFDKMITYGKDYPVAKELLSSGKGQNGEVTVIPTGGFSVDHKLYINFMSVHHWGDPGKWDCNYAGLAVSKDNGQNFTKLENMRWPGNSNFIQVTTYKKDGDIYFWCIPSGRFGGVKLMKVPENSVENFNKYVYYTGENGGIPQWSSNMKKAAEIVPATVGELSVIWDEYLNRWIMTYLNPTSMAIEIREGINPWGPWGKPFTVVTSKQYPGFYGAFMTPKYVEENGKVIYFTMSLWNQYNVYLMRAELEK